MVFEFDDRNIMITRMELYSFDDFTFQTIINNNQESNNRIHWNPLLFWKPFTT